MPRYIDTHTHVFLPEFDADLDVVMARASDRGVKRILLPNIDSKTVPRMHRLADRYPGRALAMIGLHPCAVREDWEEQLRLLEQHLVDPTRSYYGIAEIGMDRHWDMTYIKEQEQALIVQLDWAAARKLPVSLHTRKATSEVLDILESSDVSDGVRGVFHCFGGTESELARIISLGYAVGIGGVYSFKNSPLRGMLQPYHLDHIVFETDAPYLAPSPYRGRRCEPSYIPIIAGQMAETMGISRDEIAERTSANAMRIFGLIEEEF